MAIVSIVAMALLLKHVKAEALSYPTSNRPCVDFMLPVSVSAGNALYDINRVDNNIDATQFAIDYDTWDIHGSPQTNVRNVTVNGTYGISVQLCVPASGAKKTNLQVATHGLIFDKRYWDVAINASEYSYVDAALKAGYSILTYDRLGTGLSDKPDAYTVVQAPLQLEILRGLHEQARSGKLLQHANSASNTTTTPFPAVTFDKIIDIGHSFGSMIVGGLLATYPNTTDAAVLTGFIPNPQLGKTGPTGFEFEFAAQNDPQLFGDRGSGYIVPGTKSAVQTGFFSTHFNASAGLGGFDPALLDYGFKVRQPATISEWLTLGSTAGSGAATDYKGPLQFVVGEYDFAACRGDCKNTYSEDTLNMLWPNAKQPIDVRVQWGTGHGLTLHRGAKVGYQATLSWLDSNGL